MAESPNDVIRVAKQQLLADLRHVGYLVVHSDQVPDAHAGAPKAPIDLGSEGVHGWETGWNACRAAVIAAAS